MGELLSQVNGYNIIFVPADNALHESTQNCLILETRGIYLFFPEVICLFHILSPELSPPKHINGQFYEILFYHIYEKLVCVGLYSLLCKLHYSSVFIFWENKMLINSGQETYNGWHDGWQIEMCSCHPLPVSHWSDRCVLASDWLDVGCQMTPWQYHTRQTIACYACNAINIGEILHINEYWVALTCFMRGFIDKGYKCKY